MSEISDSAQIKAIFTGYGRGRAQIRFPTAGTLNEQLNQQVAKAVQQKRDSFVADQMLVRLFASAAIEMWQRALHSFVISTGLTRTSPLWSAVAGYYSSHYVMRGYAHLLGRYLLYRQKKSISLAIVRGGYYCLIDQKTGLDREHKIYWKIVRESDLFGKDPFNDVDVDAIPQSDGAHRTFANYVDHIGAFGIFQALSLDDVVDRIHRISEMELSALPLPSANKFPDLDSVQIIAYHRIVRFRKYLDDLLGNQIEFWNVHRAPDWCERVVDFQLTDPLFLTAPSQS